MTPARADRVLHLDDLGTFRAALAGIDVVINAAGTEDLALAVVATECGAAFVDITATTGYMMGPAAPRPHQADPAQCGPGPGLTNLLAVEAHRDASAAIDVAVLLGAGERHGVAATACSYRPPSPTFPPARTSPSTERRTNCRYAAYGPSRPHRDRRR